MMSNVRIGMLCCLAILASVRPASACSCAMRPVCAAFWEADRVFTGRAEVTALGPGAQRTRFRVEESFRGPEGGVAEIISRGIGGSCAYAFVHGTRYLVFARRAPDGTWNSFFCDPTTPLDQADTALVFAREVARDARRGGQLFGAASIVQRAPDGQLTSVSPLSGAMVVVRSNGQTLSVKTDPNGQYGFKEVPPGRYTLTVPVLRDFEPIPPATIEIKGPGACANHAITAIKKPPK
jgi:carboxypeptidase family protein